VDKPTVYLDTNIISAYWYEGDDVAAAARRFHTIEWWDLEREHFAVYVSMTTINELQAGSFRRQSDCLKMARSLPRLAMTRLVKHVLDELIGSRVLPDTKPGDALQMAGVNCPSDRLSANLELCPFGESDSPEATRGDLSSARSASAAAGLTGNHSSSAFWPGHTQEKAMSDVIVDEIRRVREELIRRYGGIDGYFKRCQAQERAQRSRSKARRRKKADQVVPRGSKAT
jgi:hypothetical protein